MNFATHPCSLGFICIASIDNTLCGLEIATTPSFAMENSLNKFKDIKDKTFDTNNQSLLDKVLKAVNDNEFNDIDILLFGTKFQKDVWTTLQTIKSGTTVTYKQLANMINNPRGVRAVGTACRTNPIAIIIPCHRVVPKSGGIGNYRWGTELKQFLIDREYSAAHPMV